MTDETAGYAVDGEETVGADGAVPMDEVTPANEPPERHSRRRTLPWIGALENPGLGPMVVLNESGYLVPLLTASDLLRGCRYYWHRSQE